MAIRAYIGYRTDDGFLKMAYSHYNNYIEENGVTLLHHYDTLEKVKSLIGDYGINVLGKSVKETEFFDKYGDVFLTDYSRCLRDITNNQCGIELVYVFENGEWFVASKEKNKLQSLKHVIDEIGL